MPVGLQLSPRWTPHVDGSSLDSSQIAVQPYGELRTGGQHLAHSHASVPWATRLWSAGPGSAFATRRLPTSPGVVGGKQSTIIKRPITRQYQRSPVDRQLRQLHKPRQHRPPTPSSGYGTSMFRSYARKWDVAKVPPWRSACRANPDNASRAVKHRVLPVLTRGSGAPASIARQRFRREGY